LTAAEFEILRIPMRGKWISFERFEHVIARAGILEHLQAGGTLLFEFDASSGLPAGVGMRLLSLLNQLAAAGGKVGLAFASRENLFSYLDRNGFFDYLDDRIATDPGRPAFSGAELHRGQATSLVEIAELNPTVTGQERDDAVTPLVNALIRFYPKNERTMHLHSAAYATLCELIDNVYSHSETTVPGFAVLQRYRGSRPAVQVAVSDSGIGIPESIRRGLKEKVRTKRDDEIIIAAFVKGLSRHGSSSGRSCGLPRCAQLAAEFGSRVQVRTPSADVTLEPTPKSSHKFEASIHVPNALLRGTHVCIEFPLDAI
jgi:histidine kinase/DNA gyrase B/HSP90-like ATPase